MWLVSEGVKVHSGRKDFVDGGMGSRVHRRNALEEIKPRKMYVNRL